jgi:hypothetical protein
VRKEIPRIPSAYLIYHIPRVGDFASGDPIRREPIVLDQYGGYVIPKDVSSKLTLLSKAPLPLNTWAGTAAIQADTNHINLTTGQTGEFLKHRGIPLFGLTR